jgi:hypothetical protein
LDITSLDITSAPGMRAPCREMSERTSMKVGGFSGLSN